TAASALPLEQMQKEQGMRSPKNVLIIHADQMRYDALGCSGNEHAVTPNIDALADAGTVFDRHIVSNPVCMPSRATLLTGLYPPAHGVYANGVPLGREDYVHLTEEERERNVFRQPATIADLFAGAGYQTASFGKLHCTPYLADATYGFQESRELWESGALGDWHGPYYGFQHVEMTWGHGEQPCMVGHYAQWLEREHPDVRAAVASPDHIQRPVPGQRDLWPSPVPSELHNTTWLADRFCRFLEGRGADERPFFAFVGFPDPHHPFVPPRDLAEQFEGIDVPEPFDPEGEALRGHPRHEELRRQSITHLSPEERRWIVRYTYAMVHLIDRAAGRMIQALKDRGLYEDTVLVFTSDHGDFLCDHGLLRKTGLGFDPLLHVPFVMRAPGADLPGRVALPMSNADVLPTLAGLCGVGTPGHLHGEDIVAAVRSGADRYALAYCNGLSPARSNYTVYDSHHRMTLHSATGHVELFDHRADPGETRDLASEPSSRGAVKEMTRVIQDALLHHYAPRHQHVARW
ncbi:MAG: sulfatase family protein, partial [Planctomycetota bacterium]